MNKNWGKCIIVVIYLVVLGLLVSFIPTILSGGNSSIEEVMSSGKTAKIYQSNIVVDENIAANLDDGDTIYIGKGLNNETVVSEKPASGLQKASVDSVSGQQVSVKIYAYDNTSASAQKKTPGMSVFKIMLFAMGIVIPLVIMSKNGSVDLSFLSVFSSSGKGKKKSKYGDLGSANIGTVGQLKPLCGNDGFSLSKKVRLSAKTSYEHALILGPTGSGKSTSFFIPNLLDLDGVHSAVVTDPKGEMYDITSDYLLSLGYNIIKLCPLDPSGSDFRYNPLLIAEDNTDIRDIAQLILTNGNKAVEIATGSSSGGAEWINMSVPLFTAALAWAKKFSPSKSISDAINVILTEDLDGLKAKFMKDEFAYEQYLYFAASAESPKTLSSIKTVLTSNAQIFADPKVKEFTTVPVNMGMIDMKKAFSPKMLREAPTVLFVCVPEIKSNYVMPLMSVFYTQLLGITMKYKDGSPVLYFLDEFANIGVIPNIANIAATARSRKIGLAIALQGVEQLTRNYGEENANDILNNLKSKVILSGLTGRSAEYVSDLAGVTTVETKNYSNNSSNGNNVIDNIFAGQNISKSGQQRSLITKDEIRTMDPNKVLIIAHDKNPTYDDKNVYYNQKKYTSKLKK